VLAFLGLRLRQHYQFLVFFVNLLNAELNPICHLLALLGAHHIFHVSRLRVKHFEKDLIKAKETAINAELQAV
jgi:hypothetical protein